MPAATLDLDDGDLVIPNAWCTVENLLDVETGTGTTRDDVLIPGEPGEAPRPEQPAPAVWDLRLIVTGKVRHDGSTSGTTEERMTANVAHLKAATAPVTDGDGTRPAAYTHGSLELIGDVKTELSTNERARRWGRFVLRVRLPAGDWSTPPEPEP